MLTLLVVLTLAFVLMYGVMSVLVFVLVMMVVLVLTMFRYVAVSSGVGMCMWVECDGCVDAGVGDGICGVSEVDDIGYVGVGIGVLCRFVGVVSVIDDGDVGMYVCVSHGVWVGVWHLFRE